MQGEDKKGHAGWKEINVYVNISHVIREGLKQKEMGESVAKWDWRNETVTQNNSDHVISCHKINSV